MVNSIDVILLIRQVLKRWYLFVAVAVISLFAALVITAEVQPDVYQATTSLSSFVEGSYADSVAGFRLLSYYSGLVKSDTVTTAALDMMPFSYNLTARQIQSMVTVSFDDSVSVLYITSTFSDPQFALIVANAVAEAFVTEISNLTGDDTIRIYNRANNANRITDGQSAQMRTRITVPLVSEFLLLVVIVLWVLFSDRIKSVNEASFYGDISVIGVIPKI